MMNKPQPSEYPEYSSYAMKWVENDLLKQLEARTTTAIDFYNTISEEVAQTTYAEGKWTLKEVLGHVIDTERIFTYRILAFARGETQALPGFEQDDYVKCGNFNNRTWQSLVNEFTLVRNSTLALIQSLPEDLTTREGNANGYKFSIRALIALVTGHEMHHANIIQERYLHN